MIKKRLSSIVLLVLILALMILFLGRNPELINALKGISLKTLLGLVLLRLAFMAVNGYTLKLLAAKFDVQLMPVEWLGLPVVTTMGNYLAPFSAGMFARAAYLKQRHTLPYSRFFSLLTANYWVNYWFIGLIGSVVTLTFWGTHFFSWIVFLIFSSVTLGLSFLRLFPQFRIRGYSRITKILNTAIDGWYLIRGDKKLLIRLMINMFLIILLHSASFWFAFTSLEETISFRFAMLISLMMLFSLLFNLTPGNFGVPEMIASLTSGMLGIGTGEALLASLLIRSATIIIAFGLGPVFSLLLGRRLSENKPSTGSTEDATNVRTLSK